MGQTCSCQCRYPPQPIQFVDSSLEAPAMSYVVSPRTGAVHVGEMPIRQVKAQVPRLGPDGPVVKIKDNLIAGMMLVTVEPDGIRVPVFTVLTGTSLRVSRPDGDETLDFRDVTEVTRGAALGLPDVAGDHCVTVTDGRLTTIFELPSKEERDAFLAVCTMHCLEAVETIGSLNHML
mmetsp:Transcript_121756/g.279000  ORF Transcript_121756/g.279000 Transcript_121756/m.279000 type:complete len:177 (+) Transcript_121756:2-532(+)